MVCIYNAIPLRHFKGAAVSDHWFSVPFHDFLPLPSYHLWRSTLLDGTSAYILHVFEPMEPGVDGTILTSSRFNIICFAFIFRAYQTFSFIVLSFLQFICYCVCLFIIIYTCTVEPKFSFRVIFFLWGYVLKVYHQKMNYLSKQDSFYSLLICFLFYYFSAFIEFIQS